MIRTKHKNSILLLLAVFCIWICGCSAVRSVAPTPLPNVKPEYESADFWIKRIPDAQKTILSTEQIREANAKALKADTRLTDIFSAECLDRSYIVELFSTIRSQFREGTYVDHTNRPVSSDLLEKFFLQMDECGIPAKIEPVFGLITRVTELRELPTEEVMMGKPDDIAFDLLQYARLECGTPVRILHYSANREWTLVQTNFAAGWIRTLDMAIGDCQSIFQFDAAFPLVITGEHADVYLDENYTIFAALLPMGAKLPLNAAGGPGYKVSFPIRDSNTKLKIITGFIKKAEDVHVGYLPYTYENTLRQAFKLRGQPYGWGGLFGGRDCSRFIRDIFRCFGFNMPANSFRQANFVPDRKKNVSELKSREKMEALELYENRPSLLYLKGHIMLYLGSLHGRGYAIHSTWAYSDQSLFREHLYQVGRVVVSDLSLGGKKGSLLDRLLAVTRIE